MVASRTEPSEAAPAQQRRRRQRTVLPLALTLWDIGLAYGAFALAYAIRYPLAIGPRIQSQVSFVEYQPVGLILVAVVVPVLVLKGAYRNRMSRDAVDEFTTVAGAATIAVSVLIVVTALLHRWEYSRALIAYVWVLLILTLGIGRAAFRAAQGAFHRRGWAVTRVLVVGGSDMGKMVMQSMMSRRDLGYQPAGFVYLDGTSEGGDFGRFRALGTVSDIPRLLEDGSIDEVVVALPASEHAEIVSVLQLCERFGVGLKLIPDFFEMSLSRVDIDDIAGVPLLDVQESPPKPISRVVKRALDIVVAGIGLLLTFPLVAILAILIRLESPGPAFLVQERVGLGGKHFGFVKLRSMRSDGAGVRPVLEGQPGGGPVVKMKRDRRRTRLGARIRQWSLDELPNFWNVLQGDMSLVGPRPSLPREVERFDDWQRRRLEVKPGMTGMWQVSGRSDLHTDEMLLMDLYYVDNWSISLDIRIMLRTLLAVAGRKGAH